MVIEIDIYLEIVTYKLLHVHPLLVGRITVHILTRSPLSLLFKSALFWHTNWTPVFHLEAYILKNNLSTFPLMSNSFKREI